MEISGNFSNAWNIMEIRNVWKFMDVYGKKRKSWKLWEMKMFFLRILPFVETYENLARLMEIVEAHGNSVNLKKFVYRHSWKYMDISRSYGFV